MTVRGWSLGRRSLFLLALAFVATAAVLVVVVIRAQVSAPTPHSAGRIQTHPHPRPSRRGRQGPAPLGASRPISVSIPAIGVDTPVNLAGLDASGALAVPQPGPHLNQAAWFDNSPTPGQPGPSIIEGHVDSVQGPSVFFRLGAIKPGDRVVVRRQDGRVLTFTVNAVRDFLKARFPTTLVYGGTAAELSQPTLRLITCSDFDPTIHHHVGNEVVFAHLTHVSPAPRGGAG